MYTNTGLVRHAENALQLKTKYMWGGIMRPITAAYAAQLIKMYPAQYSAARQAELNGLVGRGYFGCDCVGLVKSYYWSGKADGGTGSPNYGKAGFPDVNAHGMYNAAKVKGTIDTIPEVPGLVVYCKSRPHVGVYVGNGYTIESTLGGGFDGIVKRKLKDWIWEYWFECPYITYEKAAQNAANPAPAQKEKVQVGDKVRVKNDAKTYTGTGLASFVYGQTYEVFEVRGDRVVIGQKKKITAAVRSGDLIKM